METSRASMSLKWTCYIEIKNQDTQRVTRGDGWCQVQLEAPKWCWWCQMWRGMVGNGWCNKCSTPQLEMSRNGHASWVPGESAWAALWHNERCTWTIHTTSQAPQTTSYLSQPTTLSRTTETWSRRCQSHGLIRSDGHVKAELGKSDWSDMLCSV